MINKWIQVSFCLPQKVHQSHKKGLIMNPEMIDRCDTIAAHEFEFEFNKNLKYVLYYTILINFADV